MIMRVKRISKAIYIHTWGNVGPMRRVKTIMMPFLLFMRWCRGCVS